MNWVYRIVFSIVWPFVMIFNPPRTVGRENIPEGAALLCINHQSNMDPLIVCVSFGINSWLHFMAKDEVMRAPILGKILSLAGIFGVKRGRVDVRSIKTALDYLGRGEKVAIFPQGTRVPDDVSAGYKTGAAMLAIRSGAPVLPIYMESPRGRPFKRIRVVIGKAFTIPETEGKPRSEQYRLGAGKIHESIVALAGEAGIKRHAEEGV